MIETARSIFREVFTMIKESAAAFYGGVMTFLAAFFIMISIRLGQRLEKSKDTQIDNNYQLSREVTALREECNGWRDSAMRAQMRYTMHLEDDLRKSDTSTH